MTRNGKIMFLIPKKLSLVLYQENMQFPCLFQPLREVIYLTVRTIPCHFGKFAVALDSMVPKAPRKWFLRAAQANGISLALNPWSNLLVGWTGS